MYKKGKKPLWGWIGLQSQRICYITNDRIACSMLTQIK